MWGQLEDLLGTRHFFFKNSSIKAMMGNVMLVKVVEGGVETEMRTSISVEIFIIIKQCKLSLIFGFAW